MLAKSDGLVVDGHLRIKAARKLGLESVPVMLCDDMTDTQIKAFRISVNRIADLADWDLELLALEIEDLEAEGYDLSLTGFEEADLDSLFDDSEGEEDSPESNYSRKIEPPIYEITGAKPDVSELIDREKADDLITEIHQHDLPPEIARFLLTAAERHVVFNFKNIAEFYAHSDAETQDLMERSALVIIDYDKAVEQGFVKMSQAFADQFERDHPDED